jgi:hypothetical protein
MPTAEQYAYIESFLGIHIPGRMPPMRHKAADEEPGGGSAAPSGSAEEANQSSMEDGPIGEPSQAIGPYADQPDTPWPAAPTQSVDAGITPYTPPPKPPAAPPRPPVRTAPPAEPIGPYADQPDTPWPSADAPAEDAPIMSADPDAPPPAPAAAEPNQSVDPSALPAAHAPAAEGVKGSIDFKQTVADLGLVTVPLLDGCLTAKFSVLIEVAGKIEAGTAGTEGTTTITPIAYDNGAIAEKIAHSWNDSDGVRLLGWQSVFTEVKAEGAIKVDKGLSVTVAGSGKLGCGVELKFTITLVKIDDKNEVKAFSFKGGVDIPPFPFNTFSLDLGPGVKLSKVMVHPVANLELTPNWAAIGKRLFGEAAKDAAAEAVGEKAAEATATIISVDAAIIGGVILAGVSTIGAAILTIAEGDEIAGSSGRATKLADQMTEGFRIGAAGGSPPSDKAMLAGYTLGIRNYNAAFAKLQQQNPAATEGDIKAAIAGSIDQAVQSARGQIMASARRTVWEAYASGHVDSWYHSYESDRWMAWSNIYGDDPRGNPEYAKYRNEHTPGRLGM